MLEMTTAYGLNFLVPAGDTGVGRCLREFGEFARVEVEAIRQLVGSGAFVDVGANIGAIALPVAAIGVRVIAAEANRRFANVLAANALNNGLFHVEAHHAAVGEILRLAKFPMLPLSARGNIGACGFSQAGTIPNEVVQMTTLDSLAPGDTSVVKIDVEGYELQVMRGAEKILRETRPAWIVEATTDLPNNRAVLKLFVDAGYRLFWFYAPFVTFAAERRGDPALIKRGDINFLALPERRHLAWDMLRVDPAGPWPKTTREFPYLRDFGFEL
jgi:FkbM family methyltransferase